MPSKPREVRPGMYILDPVEPPKEMVIDSIDELIANMPKHRKFLEGVKKNILERYEDVSIRKAMWKLKGDPVYCVYRHRHRFRLTAWLCRLLKRFE